MRLIRTLTVSVCLLIPAAAVLSAGGDWPQYRGPDTQGRAESSGAFAAGDVGLQVVWRSALGSAYSRVVIAEGRAITMFSHEDSDFLAAHDETTGKELWRYRVSARSHGFDGSHDGPLSTPLVAGERVIGLSTAGRLFAVKAATGAPVWSVDLVQSYEASKPYYGFGASPVLVDGVVILQLGAGESAVSGFDAATGERLWSAGQDTAHYQTPAVLRQGGKATLLAAGGKHLYGLEPSTGKVLWQLEHGGGGNAYGARKITPVPAGDGRIFITHQNDSAKMVKLTRQDEVLVPETLWETRNIRHTYDTAVYHEGYLYSYSSRFRIPLDAATGEVRWRSRQPGDGFLSLVDDRLLILTKDGSLHVAEASPEGYRELAGLQLFEDHSWAAPSFANGHVFARSLGEMARVGVGGGGGVADAGPPTAPGLDETGFGRFLAQVANAADKQAVVDGYLAAAGDFPLVQDPGWVHFLYRGPAHDVAVGGDLTEAVWEEGMQQVEGTDLFYYSTRLEADARLNYVLMVDYEQVLDPRNPRKALTTVMSEDLELSFSGESMEMSWFSMPDWQEPAYLQPRKGAHAGRLEAHEVASKIVEGKAALQVYLPAGYQQSDARYPVVYVHGGNAALEHGAWRTSLDNLVGESVAPLIVVFIGDVPARGPQYTQVLVEEILPYVDRSFRTTASADGRANVGANFGALAALSATFGHPEVFGKLGVQSAALFDFARLLEAQIRPAAETPLRIYMDWGRYDLRNSRENWDLSVLNRQMFELLVERGYNPAGGEAQDGAGWPAWRNRTGASIGSSFPVN